MATTESETAGSAGIPQADGLLEVVRFDESQYSTCATLTPSIKARLKDFESGQVLEVRVDDPGARLDVPAWCRLTGNTLVAMVEEGPVITRFFLRKK
jgi:tRNA 2-thiouridine synthesizing protein A